MGDTTGLTAAERAAIQDSSGAPGRLSRRHFEAVERIVATREAAAAVQARAEVVARVEALADEWERLAGAESEAWRVFGPQTLSVPFAVEQVRAALAGPNPHPTQDGDPE